MYGCTALHILVWCIRPVSRNRLQILRKVQRLTIASREQLNRPDPRTVWGTYGLTVLANCEFPGGKEIGVCIVSRVDGRAAAA